MNGATPSGPSVLMSIRQTATAVACAGNGRRAKPRRTAPSAETDTYCVPIPTTIASRTDVVTSGELCPHAVKSRSSTCPARPNESARKKIHPKQTTWNVSRRPSHTAPRERGAQPTARSTASPRPWIPPQATNVHAAPCQSPPSSIVRSRLRYVSRRPRRFPPSET